LVLVVALVLAGVAAFSIFQYLTNVENEISRGPGAGPGVPGMCSHGRGNRRLDFVLQNPGILYTPSTEQRGPSGRRHHCDLRGRPQLEQVLRAGWPPGRSQRTASSPQPVGGVDGQISPLAELSIARASRRSRSLRETIQGVNGFVQPGDRINAMVTVDIDFGSPLAEPGPRLRRSRWRPAPTTTATPRERGDVTYTRFVLQGLRVLAVGRRSAG
jgi:hypothetical protein